MTSMKRSLVTVCILALPIAVALLTARSSTAGPEKIEFPANWEHYVLYTIVDRYDVKQYRELYASSQEAVDAMKRGQPLPDRTVLVLVQYKAQADAQGNPLKNASGRFLKGDRIGFTVMEKRQGWGAEYPGDLRNGEWEYSAFGTDGRFNANANYTGCFQCHKPHEKQDFVISLAGLMGGGGTTGTGAPDVRISGFSFGPPRLTAAPGQAVMWINNDDSPHQITLTASKARGPVLTKGQSYSHTFAAAGTYDYVCGLHPNMKGQVEVK
ncbi:MAG: hypothetical protein AUH76_19695 [Candidatus Rokubacteria bacterium 13_1_40CM_4_67_11]|nr:MAG: hypothetical protein AUH76_19695 [Candidatus Rokubacteria bacterium 13_1_40CM_4_67_11]